MATTSDFRAAFDNLVTVFCDGAQNWIDSLDESSINEKETQALAAIAGMTCMLRCVSLLAKSSDQLLLLGHAAVEASKELAKVGFVFSDGEEGA